MECKICGSTNVVDMVIPAALLTQYNAWDSPNVGTLEFKDHYNYILCQNPNCTPKKD
jgi:hypothetical protein